MSAFRHPVVAVSHGPGPLWLLKDGFMGMNASSVSAQNVRATFAKIYPDASHPLPKRILFVSAHWESESKGFEISSSKNPDMIYDYYGFPSEAYDVVYAAKGEPEFAQKVKDVLAKHKIDAKLVDRGYDHGVFVPMSLIRPEADIPIVSMSINDMLSAKAHFELGKALKSFRDDETLIICSGQATHNLRASRDPNDPVSEWAQGFQDWIDKVFTSASSLSYSQRQAELETWQKTAPFARLAHPSPDHFSPFIVAAGAGMDDSQPSGEKIIGGWGAGQLSFATLSMLFVHVPSGSDLHPTAPPTARLRLNSLSPGQLSMPSLPLPFFNSPDRVHDIPSSLEAKMTDTFRHPVVALSHGPGPLWLLKDNGSRTQHSESEAARNLRTVFDRIYPPMEKKQLPKRILFISAHWESSSAGFEISKTANPGMIYDYRGFPPESYEVVYAAKGEPEFAAHVHELLEQNKIEAKLVERGYDHGVFVPMFLVRPEADIPIVTISISNNLDAKAHFDLGKALAPLRDEHTLVIASGQATHSGRNPDVPAGLENWANEFQEWLDNTLSTSSTWSYDERRRQILNWESLPIAKIAHPTPDHFTPFLVAIGAGASEDAPASEKLFGGWGGALSFAAYAWGIVN